MDDEHQQLHDAFLAREIHPDVFERVSKVVRSAAERGEREVLAVRFSSQYSHRWRAGDQQLRARVAGHLTGFAKRAYDWQKELEPQGYKVRAQILDFPGGVPGDVGLFLRW